MSKVRKLRQLIESAKSRKSEMRWKVLSYDPELDNKLVSTSDTYDCICKAAEYKRKELKEHPNYIVEIISESKARKNEAKVDMSKLKQELRKATNAYFKNDKDILDYIYIEDKKDSQGRNVIELRGELGYNSMSKLADYLNKILQKYDRYAYFDMDSPGIMNAVFESANIDVKNPGMLEVPDGKNVDDLPMSHFEKLVDKKGYAPVIRALTNLEVWNKDKNKSLSNWASNMADKLKKKFRPESAQKNETSYEEVEKAIWDSKIAKGVLFSKVKNNSMYVKVYIDRNDKNKLDDIKDKLHNIKMKVNDITHYGYTADRKDIYELRLTKESSQINESRGYKVLVELSVRDNVNNIELEDEVEELLKTSNKIDAVRDVTAERK